MSSDPIKLVLPYPPSANRVWRTYMPKGFKAPVTVVSAEGKEYKRAVSWMCKAAGIKSPISGRVHIDIKLYPHRPLDYAKRMQKLGARWDDDVKCIDLDNANKVLFDAIKGIAIEDDRWVRKLTAERMEPDGDARVVMTITAIEIDEPQEDLL